MSFPFPDLSHGDDRQAVRLALHYGEEHLGVTDVFGEDVGPPLGRRVHRHAGPEDRVEHAARRTRHLGTAMGIAYAGGRPVCEIQFCDYAFNVIDMLKIAGNQRWAGGGSFDMPIVVMTPTGAGIRGSLYHSHCFESWASRLAGLEDRHAVERARRLRPHARRDRDPNPVMMLLPKALLRVRGHATASPANRPTRRSCRG